MWIDDDGTYCVESIDNPLSVLSKTARKQLLVAERSAVAALMDEMTDIELKVSEAMLGFEPSPEESAFAERKIPHAKLGSLEIVTSFEDLRSVLPEFVRTMEPRWRLDASDLATSMCEVAYYSRTRRVLARLSLFLSGPRWCTRR